MFEAILACTICTLAGIVIGIKLAKSEDSFSFNFGSNIKIDKNGEGK